MLVNIPYMEHTGIEILKCFLYRQNYIHFHTVQDESGVEMDPRKDCLLGASRCFFFEGVHSGFAKMPTSQRRLRFEKVPFIDKTIAL